MFKLWRATGRSRLLIAAVVLNLGALSLASCERSTPVIEKPQHAPVSEAELDAINGALTARFDELILQRIEQEGSPFRLSAKRAESWHGDPQWSQRVLLATYKDRQYSPRWVKPSGELWAPGGAALLKVLQEAPLKHGLSPQALGLIDIELQLREATAPALQGVTLEREERERLRSWLTAHQDTRQELSLAKADLSVLLDADGPLPRHSALAEQRTELLQHTRQARQALDASMTRSTLRLARALRLDHDAWQRHRQWPDELMPPKDKKIDDALTLKRREHWATKVMTALLDESLSADALSAAIAHMEPPFEDYKHLQQAHQRYVKIVDAGGWSELPEALVDLKVGAEHPGITLLKARLAAEDFWPHEDTTATFDDKLKQALLEYQRTHQIWEKGYITQETWRSLNVPARRRLMEIRQSMHQWRHSRIGEDPYYVRVNIPDFHAEIWDKGQRTWRQRVVTGASTRKFDRKTQRYELPHATKQFSDSLQYLVFSPYWNVPEAILKEEILPALEKDPEYLTKHNYEWVETSPGNRYMRQKPGSDNALGQVKFLFPNEHNIYLHDTPLKAFFDYPIRAFSHGCVRVKDPLELAKLLLEREGRYDEAKVKTWIDGGKEIWLTLKEAVPVHIEYMVVRADEQGRAHFLMDIYRQNVDALSEHDATDLANQITKRALELHNKIERLPADELASAR